MPKVYSTPIAVYRQHQDTLFSPCSENDMCGICTAHLRGKKKNTPCQMLRPTENAFELPAKIAAGLISDGVARPVNWNQELKEYTGIQLLFSRLAHLRDASCKIDLAMLIAYAEGQPRARAAVDVGWGGPMLDVSRDEWTPEVMRASRDQVQSSR